MKGILIGIGLSVIAVLILLSITLSVEISVSRGYYYERDGLNCSAMKDDTFIRSVAMAWCDPEGQEVVSTHKLPK